jgi:hypothetical protein
MYQIKIFFAVVIYMCMVKKPSLHDYWTAGQILHIDYTARVWMSQEKFLAILTILCLSNNGTCIPRGVTVTFI